MNKPAITNNTDHISNNTHAPLSHQDSTPMQITLDGFTMGMTYQIKYIDTATIAQLPAPHSIKTQIDALLEIVNNQMSTYRQHSEISHFNQMTTINTPMSISSDFAHVVATALRLNKLTEGGLDITVGPLVNLWDFGPIDRSHPPSQAEIENCRQSVGLDNLQLWQHKGNSKLSKSVSTLYLDLSSIAKGFGVDKIADYFLSMGIDNYLIEIGGELRANGYNLLGNVWQVGIENPIANEEFQIIIPLTNHALATSGDYRNCYEDEQNGLIGHVINPITQKPAQSDIASISVIAKNAMLADGIATGLYVLGAKKAQQIAEREKIAIFIIKNDKYDYQTTMSSEFKKLIT